MVLQLHTTGAVGLSLLCPRRRLLPSSLSGLTTPGTSSSSRSGWHQAAVTPSRRAATGQVRCWGGGCGHGEGGHGETRGSADCRAGECDAAGAPRSSAGHSRIWGHQMLCGRCPLCRPQFHYGGCQGHEDGRGVVLLCRATTTTTAATTTTPCGPCRRGSLAGAGCRGRSSCKDGVHPAPCLVGCHLPTHHGTTPAARLAAWSGSGWGGTRGSKLWLGKETLPMGSAKRGRSEWGTCGAPPCCAHPRVPTARVDACGSAGHPALGSVMPAGLWLWQWGCPYRGMAMGWGWPGRGCPMGKLGCPTVWGPAWDSLCGSRA